jgi:hypothetical protein
MSPPPPRELARAGRRRPAAASGSSRSRTGAEHPGSRPNATGSAARTRPATSSAGGSGGVTPARSTSICVASRARSTATVAGYHGVNSRSVASPRAGARSTGRPPCSRTTPRSSEACNKPSAMPRPSDGFVHAHASAPGWDSAARPTTCSSVVRLAVQVTSRSSPGARVAVRDRGGEAAPPGCARGRLPRVHRGPASSQRPGRRFLYRERPRPTSS